MVALVHIVANGARTALGLGAPQSAAAHRAGIGAAALHPFMIDRAGDPMTLAMDCRLDPGLTAGARMLALAQAALQETCELFESYTPVPRRVDLLLALPEPRPGFGPDEAKALRAGLVATSDLPIHIGELNVSMLGHAAGLALLGLAVERLRRGEAEMCMVGGVDSYLDPDTLDWLDGNRQLIGAIARSGFVPGEAAGFCLLMTEAALERTGCPALAIVRAVATGRESRLIKTDELCFGSALTAVVADLATVLDAPAELIDTVICDINGERYRGEEWGFTCLRTGQHFGDPTGYCSPADGWGDVGAASGPLFAMLSCEAARRGYAKGPLSLLWASSEGGLRAAALLESPGAVR